MILSPRATMFRVVLLTLVSRPRPHPRRAQNCSPSIEFPMIPTALPDLLVKSCLGFVRRDPSPCAGSAQLPAANPTNNRHNFRIQRWSAWILNVPSSPAGPNSDSCGRLKQRREPGWRSTPKTSPAADTANWRTTVMTFKAVSGCRYDLRRLQAGSTSFGTSPPVPDGC
jgi:hypothetical protein